MPRTDTRERILDLAEQLLAAKGYNGFSYQDISAPLGIRNAAVHYHFPTKADLGVAIVQRYRDLLREATGEFMTSGGSAVEQLEGYLRFFARECREHQTLCPVGTISADYFNIPEQMRQAGQRLKNETLAWLVRVFELGRAQDELRFQGDPEANALSLMATVQGARQLVRLMGPEVMETAAEQIRRHLYPRPRAAAEA